MAVAKEKATITAKPAAKAVAAPKEAEVKEAEVKKAEVKKAPAKKPATKKATAAKPAAKKAPVKKEALKTTVNLQFAGKSYTDADLIKIAKDVWKYDLGRKATDFKSVELYVKPEESRAYYVVNGEITGSFAI